METVLSRLQTICERDKDFPALTLFRDGGVNRTFSYGEMYRLIGRYALAFQQREISQGDVVLLFVPQGIDAIAAFWGAMLIGAIPSFMPSQTERQDPKLFWQKHEQLWKRIKVKLIVTTKESAQTIEQYASGHTTAIFQIEDLTTKNEAVECFSAKPEELALLQHSSGTKKMKKGVMLSHGA
ncbi:MAG: acyl--CoA ligase, partial [Bdellovibrionales bacterium]|nr:acyl--CoA ligase [Bdellovibrionales bacterium]